MIFTIDNSSFLKVINEQNTLCIPKYRGQNLACWCLHFWLLWTAFTCSCPLIWLLIWLWSEVLDPCFIHCHIFTQKLLFVALKKLQTTSELSTCCCFGLTVSKRSTHFEHSFLIDKCSCKMVNMSPSRSLDQWRLTFPGGRSNLNRTSRLPMLWIFRSIQLNPPFTLKAKITGLADHLIIKKSRER